MISLRRLAASLLPFVSFHHPLLASAADPSKSSAIDDPSCACEDAANAGDGAEEQVVRILNLGTDPKGEFAFMGIEKTAAEYYEDTGVRIQLDWINDKSLRAAELQGQLQSKLPLYDGFVIPAHLIGSAAQYDGFMDLTEIVRARPELEWSDIFFGFRDSVAVYDQRVYLLPLDGDANYMFYNAEIMEAFNLTVPRTWEEYWQVAKAVHGKEYGGKTVSGSCLGRKAGEGAGAFWAMDVLSSYTQTQGKAGGFLFDPEDMTPLLGEALAEAIRMLEMQVRYGHPNEFEGEAGGLPGSINVVAMNIGECLMTINWGDSFPQSYAAGSQIVGKMNVGALPGADKVLNRETKKLEPCTKENCGGLGGVKYDDIGWVNTAQFLAGGGWAGAVNNNVDEARKERALDFFVHMCAPEASILNLIQKAACDRRNATGVDPFRASHFDIDRWVEAGYDQKAVESYREAVVKTAANPNAAIDLRFAGGDDIYNALAEEVQEYLELTRLGQLPESEEEKQALRLQIADKISERFTQIVNEENAKPETAVPIIEQYQRDLGVFVPEVNTNQLGDLRIVGMVLLAIALACALSFGLWIFVRRSEKVVRYSQPFFLYLLCAGAIVMSCAILPLSIDDSFYGQATDDCSGCDKACIAWPWLFCLGFSIIFSTLFSKLWRVNKLVSASIRFRRIECKPKDVMLPMAIILGLNVILLSIWTAVDPPQWQRIYTDPLNSYGTCRPYGTGDDGDTTASKVIVSLLAVVNICALILAQVQAWKARTITSEVLSESKYISLAIFGNLQIFLIGLPLLVIVEDNPSARYFLSVGIIFLVCVGMLLLIFGPKIWFIRHPPAGGFDIRSTTGRESTAIGNSTYGADEHRSVSSNFLSKELAEKDETLADFKSKVAQLCEKYNIDPSEADAVFASVPVVPEEMAIEKGPHKLPAVSELSGATGLHESEKESEADV